MAPWSWESTRSAEAVGGDVIVPDIRFQAHRSKFRQPSRRAPLPSTPSLQQPLSSWLGTIGACHDDADRERHPQVADGEGVDAVDDVRFDVMPERVVVY